MPTYDGSAIEVLTGLEPVRRRPGMYTATERPNHLAQEAIDNAVDEAIAGHASALTVTLHADGSLSVADDGRGIARDRSKSGFGMTSMQERADRIGASLTIVTAPRNGTEVVLAWEPTRLLTQVHALALN